MSSSIPRSPGIYKITCTPTGKIYVGSARSMYQRWTDHRKMLRKGNHHNRYLQHAWNKYGEGSFEFSIIEMVALAEHLQEREQYWLDTTNCCNSDVGFNISPTSMTNRGIRWSDEIKERMGAGKQFEWPGFVSPDGVPVTIVNLWKFCRDNGLAHSAMYRLAKGQARTKSYKGWTHRDHPYQGRAQVWSGFIDPDGMPVGPIYNLSEFCRQRGLSPSHMQRVCVGKRPHHRGWTCKRGDDE